MTDKALVLREVLPADRHPAAVYLASLPSAGSVPAQRSALRQIARLLGAELDTLNWSALRYQHVQFVRARLMERYAPVTANRLLTALRRVLHEASRLGYITYEDYRRLTDFEPVTGSRDDVEDELRGRALSAGEIGALLAACASDESIAGARDAAVIGLAYGLGLRRAEIAKMRLSDFDADKATVKVRYGKRGKTRTLPIDDGARDAVEDWLRVRGREPGALLFGVNKGGAISSKRLNVRGIDELYAKRARLAGVENTSIHDLRRSFISDLLDKGVDVATISRLAGHDDPRTTLRYDRRKMEVRRAAVKMLHVPYRRRRRG